MIIRTDSLEIFKQNNYIKTDIGMVSDNAYLSVIATNNCQCNCPYCINSETDRRLDLPLGKAVTNIRKLVSAMDFFRADSVHLVRDEGQTTWIIDEDIFIILMSVPDGNSNPVTKLKKGGGK